MKNKISSKQVSPTVGTKRCIKYGRDSSKQLFFEQCQVKNPIQNSKNYKVDYSLWPFWVKWIDRVIEFFEKTK